MDTNTENEISLIDLGKKLWIKRRFILKGLLIGLILGIIVALSIPKEYTTTVIFAPETNSATSAGNMGALAAMAGLNLGGAMPEGQMSPELYPNIVESTPFIVGLFDIRVQDLSQNIDTTLYSYIKNEQKVSWWTLLLGLPRKISGLIMTKDDKVEMGLRNRNFSLTEDELDVFENLKLRLNISVEKKTGVITLASTMQSAEVSALVADTLTSYLQTYIISYRTQKARQDLVFTERLYTEAKRDYSDAQQKYARYLDENQNVILASYKINQEKLQNEVGLAYNVYNQMAQQLQLAKVKVQDITPVYTVIQPAVVPLIPVKPKKKMIVLGFIFLASIGCCTWILVKDYMKNL